MGQHVPSHDPGDPSEKVTHRSIACSDCRTKKRRRKDGTGKCERGRKGKEGEGGDGKEEERGSGGDVAVHPVSALRSASVPSL